MNNIFRGKNIFWNLTALLIFIAVIFFLIIPVARVLTGSFQTEEGGPWTLKNFESFAKYRTYWKSLANSCGTALAASLLTIIMAVPLAFMVSRWNIAGKQYIIALSTIPLMLPSFLSAFVWIILLGRAGIVTGLIQSIGIPFKSIGEQKPFLAVQAYMEFASEIGQKHSGMAYALSMVLILVTMVSLMAQRYYLKKHNFIQSARGRPLIREFRGWSRHLATAYCFAVVSIPLIPFLVALIISFMEMRGPVIHPNFSLDSYIYAFRHSARPIFNSYFLATMATLASVIIGVPTGYILTRRRSIVGDALDLAIMLPFTIAGTVLGIALIVMFNTGILVLTGTWMILALSYTIRKMPFVARSSSSILYQLDPSLEEASVSLGVSPMKTFFKITTRLMVAGIISGAILTWVTTISELSSTIVLQSANWSTMTIEMFSGIVSDEMGTASAFGSILIISAIVPLLIMMRGFKDQSSALF